MRLIDAAYKDCAQMMRQDESYRAYIGNISKEIWKGLNICQIQERDHRAQEERAKRYADALMHGDVNNTIKRCYGCGQPFQHDKMVVPGNLVFSRKTKRSRPDGAGGQVRNKVATNAFFCVQDMACLSMEFPKIPRKMIYMGNLTFNQLTPAHKKYLKSKGYWDAIIANRRLKAAYQ